MDDQYSDVVSRIASSYLSCSEQEKVILKQILNEFSSNGESETYENLWLSDFTEVPVSITQFICDPEYLGKANRNGDAVYPFWKSTLSNIFNSGNKYNEIILSGATRIGKTSTAVIIMSYMLYRLMIYRDPHKYFSKKEVSRFTVAFANLTKDLAEGVAYREFNDTLKVSPWFNNHGRFSNSERNFYYIPSGDQIDIVAASDAAHLLGMQTWCLIGSTEIHTVEGIRSLQSLEGKKVQVYQQSPSHELIISNASVIKTKEVTYTIRIFLTDDSYIEGTPEHMIMLSDGSYKRMDEITEDDDIAEVNDGNIHSL